MPDSYDFTPDFQQKILAFCLRDENFFTMYREVIKPKYFESEIHIDLSRIIINFFDKYRHLPGFQSFAQEISKLCDSSKVKSERKGEYAKELEELFQVELGDADYIGDQVVLFGRRQALTQAIMDSVDDVRKGINFDGVETRVKDAIMVGANLNDIGMDYIGDVHERMLSYHDPESEKIGTGIDQLDGIMEGGLGRGELGVVMAPPGTGKTLSLVNIGAGAFLDEKVVVHLSFEMNEKLVSQRYDMRFVKKTKDYIRQHSKKVEKSLKILHKHKPGRLFVKSYPTRTCTVNDVRAYLRKLEVQESVNPDVLILDYPDIMAVSQKYGERRHELEQLYEECRGLGAEFNCAVWGASQTNRSALAKKVVTMGDIAESFGKVAAADFIIALSQTKEEKRKEQLRYFIAKQRNGESDYTIPCKVYYKTMTVEDDENRNLDEEENTSESEYRRKEESEGEVQSAVKNIVKRNKKGED